MISMEERLGYLLTQADVFKADALGCLAQAVCSLILVDYWRRLRVIQEIAHAKRVQVLCGQYAIPYASLIRVLKTVGLTARKIPRHTHGLSLLLRTITQFLNWRPGVMPSLLSGRPLNIYLMIRSLMLKRCKDPRDKVYGIHSLFTPDLQQRISIDYSTSAAEVFASATRAIMERDKVIDIIAWKVQPVNEETGHIANLPSWAINFDASNYIELIFEIRPNCNANGSAKPFFRFLDKTLKTRGVRVGVIEHIQVLEWNRDSLRSLRLTTLLECSKKLLNNFHEICSVNGQHMP
jgi:hypothetical protein